MHPKWQRTILPALIELQKHLAAELEVQFIIAAHSPLIMALSESIFDEAIDKLFYPKSSYQEKAYEWDNYRLTTQVMNGYKGDKIVLDPFEIQNGDLCKNLNCWKQEQRHITLQEKSAGKI